jgi:hypothetical protein
MIALQKHFARESMRNNPIRELVCARVQELTLAQLQLPELEQASARVINARIEAKAYYKTAHISLKNNKELLTKGYIKSLKTALKEELFVRSGYGTLTPESLESFSILLGPEVDITTLSEDLTGVTLLNKAVKGNKPKNVQMILDKGADIEKVSPGWLINPGHTALDIAVYNRYTKVVKVLLERGALVSHRTISNCYNNFLFKDLKEASLVQQIARDLTAGKTITNPSIDKDITISLSELFSNKFAVAAFKGMIFTHALPYETAHAFIREIQERDPASLEIYKLEKAFSNITALIDKINLLAIQELFQGSTLACGKGIIRKIKDFSDRASYYKTLEELHPNYQMRKSTLYKKYPHPLDTKIAEDFFKTTSMADKIQRVVENIEEHNIDLLLEMRIALEKNRISKEQAIFFKQILQAIDTEENGQISLVPVELDYSLSDEAVSIGNSKSHATKRQLEYEENEIPVSRAKIPTLEMPNADELSFENNDMPSIENF